MNQSPHQLPPPGDQAALVILGLDWAQNGCLVRLRIPDQPSQLVPAVGLELNYRVLADPRRHCIGHVSPRRNNGIYVDCRNRPQPTERTCVGCAVANAELASDLHHAHNRDRAELDRAVVDHLEQANVLYLAAFRDGSIKVGTSTGHRITKRLTEQGAWRAVQVATVADGFVVRRLEDLITEKLGIPQSVAVKRKVQGMASPLSDAMLDQRLDPVVAEVHDLLRVVDRFPGSSDLAPGQDGFELRAERWSYPGADDGVWDGLHRYPARLDAGAHHFQLVEMCGRMAVLARPGSGDRFTADGDRFTADGDRFTADGDRFTADGDRFIADLGSLYGIELDLGQYEPDQLVIQDSLF